MSFTIILFCILLLLGYSHSFVPNSNLRDQRHSSLISAIVKAKDVNRSLKSSSKYLFSLESSALGEDPLEPSTVSSEDTDINEPTLISPVSQATKLLSDLTQAGTKLAEILAGQQQNDTNAIALPDWVEPTAWRGVIIVLCALWASNFAVAKMVMAEPGVDSSLYALSRFGVAVTSLTPFAIRSLWKANSESDGGEPIMDFETLKSAIVCGSWVAFGYLGQTVGLLTTTASKSCVICSMHCVFVAVIAEIWRVQNVNSNASSVTNSVNGEANNTQFDVLRLLPAAVAVIGVAIVELWGAGGSPTIGDALSFAQPIGFGMGYLILENIMARKPEAALPVSTIKLAVVLLFSSIMFEASPLLHGGSLSDITLRVPDFSPILHSQAAMLGILYTGLVTTALALWVESIAFAKVPATDASLILTTEPIFAAGCAAVTLGETFQTSDYVGASLIVGACALSIVLDKPKETVEPAFDS